MYIIHIYLSIYPSVSRRVQFQVLLIVLVSYSKEKRNIAPFRFFKKCLAYLSRYKQIIVNY